MQAMQQTANEEAEQISKRMQDAFMYFDPSRKGLGMGKGIEKGKLPEQTKDKIE